MTAKVFDLASSLVRSSLPARTRVVFAEDLVREGRLELTISVDAARRSIDPPRLVDASARRYGGIEVSVLGTGQGFSYVSIGVPQTTQEREQLLIAATGVKFRVPTSVPTVRLVGRVARAAAQLIGRAKLLDTGIMMRATDPVLQDP